MPKKIQTHLKQKTWRCSEKEVGSVQVIIIIISLFFKKEEKEGRGVVHPSWSRAKHLEQEAVFFFFFFTSVMPGVMVGAAMKTT